MSKVNLSTLAKECYERSMLAGFIEQQILVDGEPFSISPVEAAVTEYALECLETGENVHIQSSFPTKSIPVALGVAITYKQHPRRGGDGSPILMFPRQGYTTVFDKIHYKRACDPVTKPNTEPVPRYPVGAISEIPDDWKLYTTKSQFTFDGEAASVNLGAIVVDLRAPRWGDTYAPQIKRFLNAADANVIFISELDSQGLGSEIAKELASEQFTIRPEHLEQSPIEEIPVSKRTPLSTVEEVLATEDVSYYYYSVGDQELADLYPSFVAKKIELQNRDIAPAAVGGLYNRLVQLPVKPEFWNKVSTSHGYFDSIPQQIEHLETVGEQLKSNESRINNFTQRAREIQSHLNDRHVLQNYLLNIVEKANQTETRVRLVFSNDREKEAFIVASETNGYSIESENFVELHTKGDIEPENGPKTIFAGAPPHGSYHYEFPPSQEVVFMYFGVLDDYITKRGKENAGDTVTHTHQTLGNSDIDLSPVDLDQIEADVEQVTAPSDTTEYSASAATTDLLGDSSLWEVSDEENDSGDSDSKIDQTNTDSKKKPQQTRVIEFEENHEPIELSPLSQVTLFHPDKGEIERTRAQSLEPGQTIILLDDIADDIYDVVLNSAREREQVREDENLVEGWRDQLNSLLENGWTVQELHTKIREMGSDIESAPTISLWRYGRTLAPEDEDDIKRIYQLARPGIDSTMFDNLASEVAAAADRLRRRHQKIGRNIRPLIEYELDASTTEVPEYYDEETRRRIREDTERLTIARTYERTPEE